LVALNLFFPLKKERIYKVRGNIMEQILVFLLVLCAIAIIILVLMQQGKGADVGAAFGSGASNTVFGSQGSGSFLMKITSAFAVAFFAICIILARMAVNQNKSAQQVNIPTQQSKQVSIPTPVTSAPVKKAMSDVPAVPKKG
jgi:preprotein translocase subunit SecG